MTASWKQLPQPPFPGQATHSDAHGDRPLLVEGIPSQGIPIHTTPSYACLLLFSHLDEILSFFCFQSSLEIDSWVVSIDEGG